MTSAGIIQPSSKPVNPLNSWAWTFIILNSAFNLTSINTGTYHWYYFLSDIALIWFIILWIRKSPIAGKVFLFNFVVSFFAYQRAYILNILERPGPIVWCILIALRFWGFASIWQLQKEYFIFLRKLNDSLQVQEPA